MEVTSTVVYVHQISLFSMMEGIVVVGQRYFL